MAKYILAALLLSSPLGVLSQEPTPSSLLGPSPGCYKGSAIGAKMIPVPRNYSKEVAAEDCFNYCATLVPETRVLANIYDKSNRRKSRVQCKCFDAEDAVNPVSLTCLPEEPSSSTRKGRMNDKAKNKNKNKNKDGIKGGKWKKCKKCTTVGPKVGFATPEPMPTV